MSDRQEHDADLIIAGAGCAGLSALWHAMTHRSPGRRIIVVDRDLAPGDDRTWAFWGTADEPFADLADRSWGEVVVRVPGWESTARLGHGRGAEGRRYWRVRRRDYDQRILAAAHDDPDVEFVEQPILGLHDVSGGAAVRLTDGEISAPVVFQSTRLAPRDAAATVRHPFRQHFGGWEVRTERPVFTPGRVTLMDFDIAQQYGGRDVVAFFYVLPEAPDRALVEHTVFALGSRHDDLHDRCVEDYLDDLGAGAVEVVRTEYGSIPMEDRTVHQRWGDNVWNLGTVGGMTKPTTGYTFQRIHRQTRHLVDTWMRTGRPAPLPAAALRYRFADRILLNVLHRNPGRGRDVFGHLFRTTSIDQVLTFLDESSRRTSDLRMMARMPWPTFVPAAAQELLRSP